MSLNYLTTYHCLLSVQKLRMMAAIQGYGSFGCSHRYKNWIVVITHCLTITKYRFIIWLWAFPFYVYFFLFPLSPRRPLPNFAMGNIRNRNCLYFAITCGHSRLFWWDPFCSYFSFLWCVLLFVCLCFVSFSQCCLCVCKSILDCSCVFFWLLIQENITKL